MKNLKTLMLFVLLFFIISCQSQSKGIDIKDKIAIQLLESIYENDSLSSYTYSGTPYFHCNLIDGKGIVLAEVVLTQKSAKVFCYSMDISGIKAFVYVDNCNDTPNKLGPFFIPDVRGWRFAIEVIGDNFVFYKLKRYPNIHHKEELDDSFKL